MPHLSVIIPIYNAEAHLEALVATLREQRVLGPEATIEAEVLLVDDGSTDASLAMLDRIASEYPAAVVLHSHHGGPAGARNVGLDAARGRYVYFMDQDDYIVPGTLECMMAVLASAGADTVHFAYAQPTVEQVDEWRAKSIGTPVWEGPMTGVEFLKADKLRWNTGLWNNIYSMDVIRRHAIRFSSEVKSFYEDAIFNYLYYLRAGRVVCTESVGYLWVQNLSSESRSTERSHMAKRLSQGSALALFYFDMYHRYSAEEGHDRELASVFLTSARWFCYAFWHDMLRIKGLPRRTALEMLEAQEAAGLMPMKGPVPVMGKGFMCREDWHVIARPWLLRLFIKLRLS
ncbi:MAG: glycosyltransferase [Muribaculaceae bacterium]|nr:glycosyltransferase [Muribaculaceae bacterium]